MILYYIHDPMCSWCWGFKPVLQQLQNNLPRKIKIKYLLGGLAPDTDVPMPVNMRSQITSTWKNIQKTIPGTQFNYDFWDKCTPKRSTYTSCRAVLSAAKQQQNKSFEMLTAIQNAYYLHALNPSEISTLRDIASSIGLNTELFINDITSKAIDEQLKAEIAITRDLGVDSFPSLILNHAEKHYPIAIDYNHSDIILEHIESFL